MACEEEQAALSAACTTFDLACLLRDQKAAELAVAERLKMTAQAAKMEAQQALQKCLEGKSGGAPKKG